MHTPNRMADAALLAETQRLRERFAPTAPQPWNAITAVAELTMQLGHLAACLLQRRRESLDLPTDRARPIIDLGDELADVVLGVLSVCVLANTNPEPVVDLRRTGTVVDEVLQVLTACGALSEAAMVQLGYRHLPEGQTPSIDTAASIALRRCDILAWRFGLDLCAEFWAMTSDAHRFLDERGAL